MQATPTFSMGIIRTLKTWEWPGNEANMTIYMIIHGYFTCVCVIMTTVQLYMTVHDYTELSGHLSLI